jgi:hypothetical protein
MVPVNSTEASERAFEALLRRREEKMALTPIKLVAHFVGPGSLTKAPSAKTSNLGDEMTLAAYGGAARRLAAPVAPCGAAARRDFVERTCARIISLE